MPDTVALESLHIALKQRITSSLEANVARLAIYLTQLMREAYQKEFTVNDAGGAADSIAYELTRTGQYIELIIGGSKANSYLQYLEYGVRGTVSTPAGGALYSRTKAPPIRNIYEWIRRATLPVPMYFLKRAESIAERVANGSSIDTKKPWYSTDPITQYAYSIAQNIKKLGTPALHVIERVLREQAQKIEDYLSQSN